MKKIISFLLCIFMCTAATFAAVPEKYKDRNLLTVSLRGQSNIDNAEGTNYGTINFEGVADGFVTRVLKSAENPDDYCLKYTRTSKDGSCRFFTPDSKGLSGIWTVSFDFMRETDFAQSFSIKINGDWCSPARYDITADGKLILGANTTYTGMQAMHWYNITLMFDTVADKTWSIVKDLESDAPEVVSEPMSIMVNSAPLDIQYVNYIECSISASAVNTRTFYCDNIICAMMAYEPVVEIFGVNAENEKLDDGVDYENAKIAIEISEKVDKDTIPENAFSLSYGDKNIPVEYTYDEEKNVFYIETEEVLMPNTDYTVSMADGAKTVYGASVALSDGSIKTMKQPYGINDVTLPDVTADSEFTVSVEINNREAIDSENVIFALCYDSDGALCSINTVKTSGTEDKKIYPVKLFAPSDTEGMRVKVMLAESITVRKLIDVFE